MPLPPQASKDHRRHAFGEGRELGLVCRRLEPRTCGRPTATAGKTQDHLYPRGRRPYFLPHHQPFNYFARFAPGTPDRMKFLRDGDDFVRDIDAGTLPQVAFYKPVGRLTEHPSYTDLVSGDLAYRRNPGAACAKARNGPKCS